MEKALIEKLEAVGFFQLDETTSFFTEEYRKEDLDHVKSRMGKNHFSPSLTGRHVFFGKCISSKDKTKMVWYSTSHIRGEYRRYRGRTSWETDTANIFASGETLEECVDNFIQKYNKLEYNER